MKVVLKYIALRNKIYCMLNNTEPVPTAAAMPMLTSRLANSKMIALGNTSIIKLHTTFRLALLHGKIASLVVQYSLNLGA
jgi:hypothetical protein